MTEAVPGQTKMSLSEWQQWSQQHIAIWEAERQEERLNQGKGKRVIFSPFQGEWGHRCMHHVRLVHFIRETTDKIVCCKRGEEVLYPTANSFYYDWQDQVPDDQRMGTDRCIREWPDIARKFPDHLFVQSGGVGFDEEWQCIEPSQRIKFNPKRRGLKVDICIGTRSRGFLPAKNWQHAQVVADALTANGYSFATIGNPFTAYHLKGEVCMSGQYDTDAAIELIEGCKLYFGQDSGGAHLASTVGCDMCVLDVPDLILQKTTATTRTFYDRMQLVNKDHRMTRIDRKLWDDPQAVATEVLKALK